MTFYQKCIGGVLGFQTIGDSPLSKEMPDKMKRSILQGTLRKGMMTLIGSDLVNNIGLIKGNSVSILLNCENEKKASVLYKKLSIGGSQIQHLEVNHFGILMGGLTDRYGYQWIVQCSKV
jgi:PhnB protein